MQIIHKIDDFLFTIFPELTRGGGDNEFITHTLENYYTYGPYKPKVIIDKDWVTIEIDTPAIISQEADYRKTVALCEKGKYSEAIPILKKLIEKNPTNSEYHRIMGQILSDEGDQEEAINTQKSIRKAPQKKPRVKMSLRGFAVYFLVGCCRRKVRYWVQSISLISSMCLFFKMLFLILTALFHWVYYSRAVLMF